MIYTFLTLTFNNDSLESLSSDTRKQCVVDFLSSLKCKYVANIDFGKKKGREHYHAVVQCDNIDCSLWRYGAINTTPINCGTIHELNILERYLVMNNEFLERILEG